MFKSQSNEYDPGSVSGVSGKMRRSLFGGDSLHVLFRCWLLSWVCSALLLYFKENQKANKNLMAKREAVGRLPRMVATMEQELKASRNVSYVERFKGNRPR